MLNLILVTVFLTFPIFDSYSVNCRSNLVRSEIRKCTQTVHEFQRTHERMDGNKWLEPQTAGELNRKCDEAMVS